MKRQLIAIGFGLALPVGSAVASVLLSMAVGRTMAAVHHDDTWRRTPTRR
jgi:hypothetical protein